MGASFIVVCLPDRCVVLLARVGRSICIVYMIDQDDFVVVMSQEYLYYINGH
jgi:hypothetical protein